MQEGEEKVDMTPRALEILRIMAKAMEEGEDEFCQFSAGVRSYEQDMSVLRH